MLENITPRIQQISSQAVEFDAMLAVDDNSVKVTAKIDDDGLINSGDFAKAEEFADIMIDRFPNFQFGYLEKTQARAGQNASPEELDELMDQAFEVAARNSIKSPARVKMTSPEA